MRSLPKNGDTPQENGAIEMARAAKCADKGTRMKRTSGCCQRGGGGGK